MSVEVSKSQKALYILNTDWELSVNNNSDFSRIYSDFSLSDNKVKIFDFFNIEFTFFNVKLKTDILKLSKNCLNMNLMFLSVLTVNQNIVNVDSDKNIKAVSENVINVALKETWDFTEFKEYDKIFKQTVISVYSSLYFSSSAICSLLKAAILLSLIKIINKINRFRIFLIKSSE